MSAVACGFAVLFGIGWTILAYNITKDSPFPVVGTIFPLFGIFFVIMGIVSFVVNLRNATAKNRNSIVDILDAREEPDPLNILIGKSNDSVQPTQDSTESRLAKLELLRSSGTISQEEYTINRKRILSEI